VALVVVTFFVGRRLFEDAVAGLCAAALVAINPFQIYYAQEARMYAMLALWAMASSWAMLVFIQSATGSSKSRFWPLLAYVLTAVAGLYTHYAFPFVLLTQNLFVALWLWNTRGRDDVGRRLVSWVIAQIALALLYLPWLPTAWQQVTSWSPPRETQALSEALADIWRLLNFGQTVPTQVVVGGLISAGALLFLSLFPPINDDETDDETEDETTQIDGMPYRLRWLLPVLLVVVPAGLIVGLGLFRPAYQKFLLVSAAPLSLLVARGTVGGWRISGGVGVWGERESPIGYRAVLLFFIALFLFDTARSLNNLYYDETYARADYRAISRAIEATAHPDDAIIDAIILNAPNQWEVFTYYHPDDDHVFPVARQRPFNAAINQAELEQIAADHQRLYAIYWGDAESDPERFVETWLESHTYKAAETWVGDVRVAVYAVPVDVADAPAARLDAVFNPSDSATGPAIWLDGYTLPNDELGPGDILQLALFWRAEEPIPNRYKVFVHLYDGDGQLVAQTDSEPGGALRPTDTWLPGETVIDRYGVLIPLEVDPGSYTLAVGLYDVADPSSRLVVTLEGAPVGDKLDVTRIELVR
jgi:hypothetical protein